MYILCACINTYTHTHTHTHILSAWKALFQHYSQLTIVTRSYFICSLLLAYYETCYQLTMKTLSLFISLSQFRKNVEKKWKNQKKLQKGSDRQRKVIPEKEGVLLDIEKNKIVPVTILSPNRMKDAQCKLFQRWEKLVKF